jgi:calcineurin-like phosphoesterase family protein
MNDEERYLRQLYLEDLGKTVIYHSNPRPRVRHIEMWKKVDSFLSGGIDDYMQLPNNERDVWVWSDQHFGHNNIIEFSDRPFPDLLTMEEHMIANFNECVSENDISIWVGDVTFMGNDKTNELLDSCNGYKILVVGNHDFNRKKLRNLNFDEVHLVKHIEINDVDMVFTHYPMENLPEPYVNVHGHIHIYPPNVGPCNGPQHINVNCEFHNYKPVNLKEIYKQAKVRSDNMKIKLKENNNDKT